MILRDALGPMTLIEIIEENHVSDEPMEPEMEEGWGEAPATNVTPLPVPPKLAVAPAGEPRVYTEHRISISWKVEDAIVAVRGDDASEVIQILQELDQYGAYAALGHAKQATMGYMPKPVVTPPQAPAQPAPGGWQAGPGQSPGQPPFGGMPPVSPAAPQGRSGPKPCPPGWFKITVPYNAKDQFKAYREQNKDAFRGKVSWGGGGDYWIAPDAVAWFQQYGPVPQ